METLLIYIAIPTILMLFGCLLAFYRTPGPKLSSVIQHFTAGIVIAAVAIELLPKIADQSKWLLTIGFLAGVALMMLVEWYAHRQESQKKQSGLLPLGLVIAVGIDVFIDGLLIGVSFLASVRSGIIITVALALELVFLGLSTSAAMAKQKVKKSKGILVSIGLTLLVPIAAILSYDFVGRLSTEAHYMIMAFGVAALLYLVTEELIIEAHELSDTPMGTFAFFIGFLCILLIS